MKKIAIILMMFCVALVAAQNENEEVSLKEGNKQYKVKGNLVEVTIYHDNGMVEQHGFFKDKKLHGTWEFFNDKGKKLALANYKQGKKTGKWLFWNNGTLKEVDYANQKIASVNEWTEKTLVVSNKP